MRNLLPFPRTTEQSSRRRCIVTDHSLLSCYHLSTRRHIPITRQFLDHLQPEFEIWLYKAFPPLSSCYQHWTLKSTSEFLHILEKTIVFNCLLITVAHSVQAYRSGDHMTRQVPVALLLFQEPTHHISWVRHNCLKPHCEQAELVQVVFSNDDWVKECSD